MAKKQSNRAKVRASKAVVGTPTVKEIKAAKKLLGVKTRRAGGNMEKKAGMSAAQMHAINVLRSTFKKASVGGGRYVSVATGKPTSPPGTPQGGGTDTASHTQDARVSAKGRAFAAAVRKARSEHIAVNRSPAVKGPAVADTGVSLAKALAAAPTAKGGTLAAPKPSKPAKGSEGIKHAGALMIPGVAAIATLSAVGAAIRHPHMVVSDIKGLGKGFASTARGAAKSLGSQTARQPVRGVPRPAAQKPKPAPKPSKNRRKGKGYRPR